ncbi:MAG TPA: tetratricopeptide repeat protein [Bacteroidales bacterium]|nr:tetratricopeptide repeat protein [Bacteroidales bacterium]
MKKIIIKFILNLLVYLLIINLTLAQKTNIFNLPEENFRLASELFNKEKFGSAKFIFNKIIEEYEINRLDILTNSSFYEAVCASELFNQDAEKKLMSFIYNYPENTKITQAWLQLARYNYKKKNYKNTIKAFNNIDIYFLTPEEQVEYYFKIGYSYFATNQYEQAKRAFYEIIDKESKYQAPANYFFAHIAYTEKNYETALTHFLKLITDPDFGPVVPYYITQIYYIQNKYEELLKIAPPLLDSANTKRVAEIARLIGEAYYKTEQFNKATPYLELYMLKTTKSLTREDFYQLGYAYYRAKNYSEAINNFRKVVDTEDSLSQNAWYLLADSYLKTNEKIFARNAFLSAYKLKYNPEIIEDALFNYAKLSYELSINPYNEAINAFQTFINNYPNSINIDDAHTYLAELLMSTKNYKDALKSIENIKIKTEKINEAWQKVAYFRAIELFNDKRFDEALPLFKKAASMRYNNNFAALGLFWAGEIYYRLNKNDSALNYYQSFLTAPGAFNQPEYNLTHYNIGYCYFKDKKYSQALLSFQKFLLSQENKNTELINDAYKRIADCYFINKDINNALSYYDKSISTKLSGIDYSLFQKAIALGILKRFTEKEAVLNQLLTEYPNSNYVDDALFELADTYVMLNNNSKAIKYYSELIDNYPKSSYLVKAKLQKGLLYFNMKEDEKALECLKNVVAEYPGTPESKEALMTIQDIYIYMNKVDEFLVYVKDFKGVSNTEEDSMTYQAIELRYMKGDCNNSRTSFENYIKTFPEGIFIINAHFYKAECDYKAAALDEALQGYDYVISKPRNKFTESALLKASSICYSKKDYNTALQYYIKLEQIAEYDANIIEAKKGIMRCYFELQSYDKAIEAAEKLLNTPKVNEDQLLCDEANLIIGRSAYLLNNIAKAQAIFVILSKQSKGEAKAEAKYYLAEIQYKLKNYDESEKEIFELINQVPSYDKWIAKGFILLADNYYITGNPFEAKQTLKAIIDNYKGTDLVEIAYAKLNAIIEAEKSTNQQLEETNPENIQQE